MSHAGLLKGEAAKDYVSDWTSTTTRVATRMATRSATRTATKRSITRYKPTPTPAMTKFAKRVTRKIRKTKMLKPRIWRAKLMRVGTRLGIWKFFPHPDRQPILFWVGLIQVIALFCVVLFILYSWFKTDTIQPVVEEEEEDEDEDETPQGNWWEGVILPDIMDVSYFPRMVINGTAMIFWGICSATSVILDGAHELMICFWPPNLAREIRLRYWLMRRGMYDTRVWFIREFTNRYRVLRDWTWLKYQKIRAWFARYLMFAPTVLLLVFLLLGPVQEENLSGTRYTLPARAKTGGYGGSTTTATIPTMGHYPIPSKILQELPWSAYVDSFGVASDFTDSSPQNDDRARVTTAEPDVWDLQAGDFRKNPVQRREDYPGEYWNGAASGGAEGVNVVSTELHYCLACQQWHCCELPY